MRFFSPHSRLAFGVTLFVTSLLGWFGSLMWWAKDEPPFVLSLSWAALVLTAVEIVNSSILALEEEKRRKRD